MGGEANTGAHLSAQQKEAAVWIGAGLSLRKTAAKVGCHYSTVFDWTKLQSFKDEVAAEQLRRIEQARRTLDAAAPAAAAAIASIAKGKQPKGSTVSARDQVRASEALLNRVRTLGPVSSVNVDATVKATVIDADTDDLLEDMRSALIGEGFTEEEAAAKVDALRSRVRV